MYDRTAVPSGTGDIVQNTEQGACPHEVHGPEKNTDK